MRLKELYFAGPCNFYHSLLRIYDLSEVGAGSL